MPITSGVPIVGFISPTEDSDTYPVTNPKYGLGGLRTIGASAGLTSIPNRRREEGMIVYAINTQTYYHLSGGTGDDNWEELTFGGVGSQGFQGKDGGGFTFPNDFPVNIAIGKTFGKYERGDTIPATGKTVTEVLNLALNENLPPTISLSSDTSSIEFNETNPSITINFGYEINSPGATGLSASLQFKLNNENDWDSLTSGTLGLTSFSGEFIHSPTIPNFNTENLNYRYVVEDSVGEENTKTLNITQTGYITPTVTWGQSLVSDTLSGISGETVTKRERGNRSTIISGNSSIPSSNISISSSSFVPMTDWEIERKINEGDWLGITSDSGLSTNSINIPPFTNDTNVGPDSTSNPEKIRYRILVKDLFNTTNYISPVNGTLSEITLKYVVFYGPTASVPSNSTEIRSMPFKIFSDVAGEIDLNTGTSYLNMFVAYPQEIGLTAAYNSSNNSIETPVWLQNSATADVNTEINNIDKTYNLYHSTLDILPSSSQLIELSSFGSETD